MSVEFLVKIRDACQMIADAANEQLERLASPEIKYDPSDFDRLFWENKEGSKGPYQQTSKRATGDSDLFQALQKILKDAGGFIQLGQYRYWFDRQKFDVIDRRKK